MPEPLDVVATMENARHIVVEMSTGMRTDIVILAGHMIVASEIRRLTTAVENLESAVRDGLERLSVRMYDHSGVK